MGGGDIWCYHLFECEYSSQTEIVKDVCEERFLCGVVCVLWGEGGEEGGLTILEFECLGWWM